MEEIMEKEIPTAAQDKKKKTTVSIYLVGIPMHTHDKLKLMNLKMSLKKGKRIKLTSTYVEALKEFAKTL